MRLLQRENIIKVLPFIVSVLTSGTAAVFIYKPFFEFVDYFLGPIGFSGLAVPARWDPVVAVFDFSYVFFLALFLSFYLDWRETLRYWTYGYVLLVILSILAAGIYIPTPIRLLFILVSASAGFLIGQGLRYIGIRIPYGAK